MYLEQDIYQAMAKDYLQQVRVYSPRTYAVLEKVGRFGSKAVFQTAFTLTCYKSELDNKGEIPIQFDYYTLIRDFPQVVGLLDQAINCLLEDWFCNNLNTQNSNSLQINAT